MAVVAAIPSGGALPPWFRLDGRPPTGGHFWGGGVSNPDSAIPSPAFTFMLLAPGWVPVFPSCRQSCDGAQALQRQQVFKRSQTHLLKGELNNLAFGHVSVCPQLQHRGLRGLLQDFASPKRLPAKTLFTRGVHVELVQMTGFEPVTSLRERALFQLSYICISPLSTLIPQRF